MQKAKNVSASIRNMIYELEEQGRFEREKDFYQHGNTSVYAHSIRVAELSLQMAERLPMQVDKKSLIRGALLHDYFLYDWHEPDPSHRLHGFTHPSTAWRNACNDFYLNEKEQNIIRRHMFPLVPIPPACREAWIVCVADKYCALCETCKPFFKFMQRRGRR